MPSVGSSAGKAFITSTDGELLPVSQREIIASLIPSTSPKRICV